MVLARHRIEENASSIFSHSVIREVLHRLKFVRDQFIQVRIRSKHASGATCAYHPSLLHTGHRLGEQARLFARRSLHNRRTNLGELRNVIDIIALNEEVMRGAPAVGAAAMMIHLKQNLCLQNGKHHGITQHFITHRTDGIFEHFTRDLPSVAACTASISVLVTSLANPNE